MNMYLVIITMFLMFATICTGVPIPRQDRINYPDLDSRNRVNEHLGSVNLFMKGGGGFSDGGGWPSTTGNPSGGGRWNN